MTTTSIDARLSGHMKKIIAILGSLAVALLPLSALANTSICSGSTSIGIIGHNNSFYTSGCTFPSSGTLVVSGATGTDAVWNGTYTITGVYNGGDDVGVSETISGGDYGPSYAAFALYTAPPPPGIPTIHLTTGDTGSIFLSGVTGVFGNNAGGLMEIGGSFAGIALAFWITHKLIGFFKLRQSGRSESVGERAAKLAKGIDEGLGEYTPGA